MNDRRNSGPAAPDLDLAAQIAAALDWWRDAGVEDAFHDEPAQWISASKPTADEAARIREDMRAAPRAPAPSLADSEVREQVWPQDLTAFAPWWLTEPWLDNGRRGGRVPPRGPKGAALMVLVPEPERNDRERLLSGPQGRLLDAMLAAMGIAENNVYVASALPRHTPMADWPALRARGFGRLLSHHIALAGPARIISFGSCIPSLLENDSPKSSAELMVFHHDGGTRPLLAARELSAMLDIAAWKATLWQKWLDWTATDQRTPREA